MAGGYNNLKRICSDHFDSNFINTKAFSQLKDQTTLVYNGNRIRWTQDVRSLEKFVENVIGLSGRWRCSGGKSKQFMNSTKDLIITWYPGKLNLLTFNVQYGEQLSKCIINALTGDLLSRVVVDLLNSCQTSQCVDETIMGVGET